jgi:hypothetical protein
MAATLRPESATEAVVPEAIVASSDAERSRSTVEAGMSVTSSSHDARGASDVPLHVSLTTTNALASAPVTSASSSPVGVSPGFVTRTRAAELEVPASTRERPGRALR